MNIGYIGGGPISNFHLPALIHNNFNVQSIGSTEGSERCLNTASRFNLTKAYCKGGWEEVIDNEVDAFCICIDTSATPEILLKTLDKNKPILVEKPIGWKLNQLESISRHPNVNNLFVAYNRRFYDCVQILKSKCENSEGGTININIPDSIPGIRQFLVNGCHMIDLLRYLAGDFLIKSKSIRFSENTKDIKSISALCFNEKWDINLIAHSLIPSNFCITVNTEKQVYELKPIEKLNLYKGLEILEPTQEEPLRRYNPKIIKSFVETSKYKPGFDLMYKNFKTFIKQGVSDIYCSFDDAQKTLETCWDLIDYEISNEFSDFHKK